MDCFVSLASCGSYDDYQKVTVYCGTDFNTAKRALIDYQFPYDSQQWGWIETWRDGKCIKTDYIKE